MSVNKYYSLSWDAYQAGICKGFAEQQSKQEFVDMTLVAEGYLVKVHKNLICLVSSYIKHIIKSAPCEHPIIFLNNVSYQTLCYLLEYIYTGEVNVREDQLQAVLRVANELKLCGLEQFGKKSTPVSGTQQNAPETHNMKNVTQVLSVQRSVNATVSNENICQYKNEYQTEYCNSISLDYNDHIPALDTSSPAPALEIGIDSACEAGAVGARHPAPVAAPVDPVTNITIDATGSLPQQYSVTKRGCPQLLLNRFVYNLHHQAQCGRRRRWRCVDYRRARCAAYVDTLGDDITARRNVHHHEYHDDIILRKVGENRVFGALAVAADCTPAAPSRADTRLES